MIYSSRYLPVPKLSALPPGSSALSSLFVSDMHIPGLFAPFPSVTPVPRSSASLSLFGYLFIL